MRILTEPPSTNTPPANYVMRKMALGLTLDTFKITKPDLLILAYLLTKFGRPTFFKPGVVSTGVFILQVTTLNLKKIYMYNNLLKFAKSVFSEVI